MSRARVLQGEVDRAVEEWDPVVLAGEVRRAERDHRGALRWLRSDGRR